QAAAGQHIRHGHNGVLAAPGDKSGFVEIASWLLDDQERLRRVRLNARQHASRQGWDSIVEHFQNYLEDACASPLVQPARSKPERPPAEDGGALPRSRE
ncbi:glycosyltransferase family 1 protein, partial [Pseudomonas aeruginosa]|nr:glycosyltransferase family 1 protein [Pseudomonas aeruginosa]